MIRRALLSALLLYVTLDVALPQLPGAFVFDPSGSVESTHVARVRLPARTVVLPMRELPSHADAPALLRDGPREHRPVASFGPGDAGPVVMSCLPRATCAPPLVAEDPH